MNCPQCKTKMEGERADVVVKEYPLGVFHHTPSYHYRCEERDAEFVTLGKDGKLRPIAQGTPALGVQPLEMEERS